MDFCTKLECLEKLTNDKHSRLLQKSVIYGQKSFITSGLEACSITLFTDVIVALSVKR
jgi:hypothetical protein